MSHRILHENAQWKAFNDQIATLETERDKALADQRLRMVSYHDGVNRAVDSGSDLPAPPQSAAAISAAIDARQARLTAERDAWQRTHIADLDETARQREAEIMEAVAGAVAVLESASAEFSQLHSMRNGLAYQTNTPMPVTAPQYRPADLLDISRQGRQPLRWDEPAVGVAGRELVGQVR